MGMIDVCAGSAPHWTESFACLTFLAHFCKESNITEVMTSPNPTWCTGYLKFPSYHISYTELLPMLQQNTAKNNGEMWLWV